MKLLKNFSDCDFAFYMGLLDELDTYQLEQR